MTIAVVICQFWFKNVPFHNFYITGWWAKALVFRDYWMSTVLSITFEVRFKKLFDQLFTGTVIRCSFVNAIR